MPQVTTEQLAEILANVQCARMVSIVAKTTPDMRKTNNPHWGNCRKIAHVNGVIGWRYQNSVNNQRAREQQPLDENGQLEYFTAESRTWGERQNNPLVEYNGNFYLELKVEKSIGHRYETNNGQEIPTNQITPHLRTKTESKRQQVDRPVRCRDYSLNNIKILNMEGVSYEVLNAAN